MLTITLLGNVPSKKNSRQVFVKNGRMINIPSKRYVEWHKDALAQIKEQKIPKVEPLYKISMWFWFPSKRRKDLDNAQASILDLLQDAGIIEDDDAKVLPEIHTYYMGIDTKNPRVIIQIEKNVLDKIPRPC